MPQSLIQSPNPIINGLATADIGLTDQLLEYNASASANRSISANRLLGYGLNSLNQLRLSLSGSFDVTPTDVTGATTIYWNYRTDGGNIGFRVSLYDGTRWIYTVMNTNISLPLTDTQTGTTLGGASKTVTGLTSTAQMVRGQQVTGTGIAAASTISTIDSATQVTLNNATSSAGTNTLTFKLPPTTAYDLYVVWNGGTPRLQVSNAWTNTTTPGPDVLNNPDGVWVNNAVINSGDSNSIPALTGRYLGSFLTTAAGQCSDAGGTAGTGNGGQRYLWNFYNRARRFLYVADTTASWTYTTNTIRQQRAQAGNKCEFFLGFQDDLVEAAVYQAVTNSAAAIYACGIGLDSTTAFSSIINPISATKVSAFYRGYPGLGYHYLAPLEVSQAAGTTTWYGKVLTTTGGGQSGLLVEMWC